MSRNLSDAFLTHPLPVSIWGACLLCSLVESIPALTAIDVTALLPDLGNDFSQPREGDCCIYARCSVSRLTLDRRSVPARMVPGTTKPPIQRVALHAVELGGAWEEARAGGARRRSQTSVLVFRLARLRRRFVNVPGSMGVVRGVHAVREEAVHRSRASGMASNG